ncbi:MAG: hypothetical protein M1835_007026 [Candelina submexicana]|nr:MAG: hypothetical protein M1835_007026 [Candelina submexicana]
MPLQITAEGLTSLLEEPSWVVLCYKERSWFIHKDILVMPRAVERMFSKTGILGDVGLRTFELFLQWLYQGTIEKYPVPESIEVHQYPAPFIHLWCLCQPEQLDIPDLAQLALERFRENYRASNGRKSGSLVSAVVRYIYANSSPGSEVRKVCAELVAFDVMRKPTCGNSDGWRRIAKASPDLIMDTLLAIRRGAGSQILPHPFQDEWGAFHEHEDCKLQVLENHTEGAPQCHRAGDFQNSEDAVSSPNDSEEFVNTTCGGDRVGSALSSLSLLDAEGTKVND